MKDITVGPVDNDPAFFVAVEGIDGSGKTTVVEAVGQEFDDVVTTREPTESWIGEAVYQALRDDETHPLVDFFLFMADRVHHVKNVVRPALKDGKLVVTDRYADSTRAYQGHRVKEAVYACGSEWMETVMEPWNHRPDLIIYLDISADTAMERCDQGDKYETEQNLQRVKENYEEMYSGRSDVIRIDAERPVDEVIDTVIHHIRYERRKYGESKVY